MNSDSHFYIGSTHNVCQDYAMSNGSNVALSDGCSGSVLTDFGSRILCVTAMYQLQTMAPGQDFSPAHCILTARPSARLLNIPSHCLDATLLFVTQNEKFITITAYGDGFIILKSIDGTFYVIKIEYLCDEIGKSFPYYINYMYDIKREEAWLLASSEQNISIFRLHQNGTKENFKNVGDVGSLKNIETSTTDCMTIIRIPTESLQDFEFVAISSDGLNTFYKKGDGVNDPIPTETMLNKLLSFKNYNGQFVKRRMQKFAEQNQKEGIHHMDDISLGVLYLGDNNECNH